MNSDIIISAQDKKILLGILARHPYTFYAYGSRVKGCASKYSDLDICYFDDISSDEIVKIRGRVRGF